MSISSVRLARVSYQMVGGNVRGNLMNSQIRLFEEQSRLATGLKIAKPSDDAALASHATELMHLTDVHAQFENNARYADEFLAVSSDALNDIGTVLAEAHTLASANVGITTDSAQRETASVLIDGLIEQLLHVANRKYRDEYIFGGTRTAEAPFVMDGAGIEFQGNSESATTRVSNELAVQYNADGAEMFGAVSRAAPGIDLDPALLPDTRLADLGGALGDGIRLGSLRIETGSASTLVDLGGAETVRDVINTINDATGGSVVASIAPSGQGFTLMSPTGEPIVVREVAGGVTARDLGFGGASGSVITSLDLDPKLTRITRIAQLRAGSGMTLADPVRITVGNDAVELDLSSAETIEDVINLINGTGLGAQARINEAGSGIEVVNTVSGAGMSISEVDGGDTAGMLGLLTMAGHTPLAMHNDGRGVESVAGPDFRVTAMNGATFDVDVSGAVTLSDVIDRINASAMSAGSPVLARIAPDASGIELTDGLGGAGTLAVARINESRAAEDLGLDVAAVGNTLTARDVNQQTPQGVFTRLMELRDALRDDDTGGITMAGEGINELMDEVNRLRGHLAARSSAMGEQRMRSEATTASLATTLSATRDLDFAESITRFTQLQMAMQASMRSAGQTMNVSLMDFIR